MSKIWMANLHADSNLTIIYGAFLSVHCFDWFHFFQSRYPKTWSHFPVVAPSHCHWISDKKLALHIDRWYLCHLSTWRQTNHMIQCWYKRVVRIRTQDLQPHFRIENDMKGIVYIVYLHGKWAAPSPRDSTFGRISSLQSLVMQFTLSDLSFSKVTRG